MTAQSQDRSSAATSLGGTLIALSGLLVLLAFLDTGERPGFIPAATVALASGAVLLAVGVGGTSIVGRSRVSRIAQAFAQQVPAAEHDRVALATQQDLSAQH